jgi:hypothetical protein
MRSDALHPQCFEPNEEPCPDGWRSVTRNLTHRDLETELSAAGWTLFYIAIAIRKTAFGLNRENMIRTALKRVIANVSLERCNCLEIDKVASHSFLGLPYVSVSGHPRHLQQGMVFSGM